MRSGVFGAILALAAAWARGAGPAVPLWVPQEFSFPAAIRPDNPFAVPFAATVRGPTGAVLVLPGFYDGHGIWKVRVSPTARGTWSLKTRSAVPELDGRTAGFLCGAAPPPGLHGGLRVDRQQPHQFVFEDGTRYLPFGYECDWLWALDASDPSLPTVGPFLDRIAAQGFNFVILNTYAHDTSWRPGRTGPDDFGPPALYPWEGSNDAPDFRRFNLAFWQHYDRVIAALFRRGLGAHLLLRVYNKRVRWPANGSPEDDRYFRWVIARYGAFPNVTWDLAKEAQYEKDLPSKVNRLRSIRALDPYRRLLTVHDDRSVYDSGGYDDLVDYRTDQQHERWREVMQAHRTQRPWPVLNAEFGYEEGPGGPRDRTYRVAQPPEEVVRRAWEVYLAGGFGAYYYTYTAWDVVRPADNPPGYAYFRHLKDFLETTAYWRLQPQEGLASAGSCWAEPGREYVVFLPRPQAITLKVEGAASPLGVRWYRALTGEGRASSPVGDGQAKLTPPEGWTTGPLAVHLGSAAR